MENKICVVVFFRWTGNPYLTSLSVSFFFWKSAGLIII